MFQFTLPRGERRLYGSSRNAIPSFNSRSREGSDGTAFPLYAWLTGFNSRSREGSDL
mgnify:CR=1 FL=1